MFFEQKKNIEWFKKNDFSLPFISSQMIKKWVFFFLVSVHLFYRSYLLLIVLLVHSCRHLMLFIKDVLSWGLDWKTPNNYLVNKTNNKPIVFAVDIPCSKKTKFHTIFMKTEIYFQFNDILLFPYIIYIMLTNILI